MLFLPPTRTSPIGASFHVSRNRVMSAALLRTLAAALCARRAAAAQCRGIVPSGLNGHIELASRKEPSMPSPDGTGDDGAATAPPASTAAADDAAGLTGPA